MAISFSVARRIVSRGNVDEIVENSKILRIMGFDEDVNKAQETFSGWREDEAARLVPLFDDLIEQRNTGAAQAVLYRLRSKEMEVGLARHLRGPQEANYFLKIAQDQIDALRQSRLHKAQLLNN